MYKAPLEDYQFVLDRVIGFDALMALIGNEEVNQELADAVLEEAGKLAGDVIAPLNHGGDMTGAKRHDDGQVITPDGFCDAYAAMGQGGWTAMEAGEDFGGQNLPMTLTTAVNELWQSANMAFALCHLLTQGQIYALQKSASPELQNIFIPPMVEGRWTGTMNLTEPQAGTDLAGIKSRAVPNGDHYLISGQKIYITYGEHDMAENIIHLVLARTPDAPGGIKGTPPGKGGQRGSKNSKGSGKSIKGDCWGCGKNGPMQRDCPGGATIDEVNNDSQQQQQQPQQQQLPSQS